MGAGGAHALAAAPDRLVVRGGPSGGRQVLTDVIVPAGQAMGACLGLGACLVVGVCLAMGLCLGVGACVGLATCLGFGVCLGVCLGLDSCVGLGACPGSVPVRPSAGLGRPWPWCGRAGVVVAEAAGVVRARTAGWPAGLVGPRPRRLTGAVAAGDRAFLCRSAPGRAQRSGSAAVFTWTLRCPSATSTTITPCVPVPAATSIEDALDGVVRPRALPNRPLRNCCHPAGHGLLSSGWITSRYRHAT